MSYDRISIENSKPELCEELSNPEIIVKRLELMGVSTIDNGRDYRIQSKVTGCERRLSILQYQGAFLGYPDLHWSYRNPHGALFEGRGIELGSITKNIVVFPTKSRHPNYAYLRSNSSGLK